MPKRGTENSIFGEKLLIRASEGSPHVQHVTGIDWSTKFLRCGCSPRSWMYGHVSVPPHHFLWGILCHFSSGHLQLLEGASFFLSLTHFFSIFYIIARLRYVKQFDVIAFIASRIIIFLTESQRTLVSSLLPPILSVSLICRGLATIKRYFCSQPSPFPFHTLPCRSLHRPFWSCA